MLRIWKGFSLFEKLSPNVRAALLTIAASVVLAALGASYKYGYDGGSKDLEAVADFKKQLPSLLENLSRLAKLTGDNASAKEDNIALKENLKVVSEKNATLIMQFIEKDKEIKADNIKIIGLTNKINRLFPLDELKITVDQSSSKRAIPNVVTIGVENIYGGNSFAEVIINNYTIPAMRPAETYSVDALDRTCIVELARLLSPSVDFVISCIKK